MRAVKSVSIDSERRVIITFLDGSTETLYPNCIWCDSEALRQLIKDLLEEKADAIVQTINNVAVASFEDGADEALIKKLLVNIEPIQDLHGYDSPWPSGGGKNRFGDYTVVNAYITDSGVLSPDSANRTYIVPINAETTYSIKILRTNAEGSSSNDDVQVGEYYGTDRPVAGDTNGVRLAVGEYTNNLYTVTFTTSENAKWLAIKVGKVTVTDVDATIATIQLEVGASVSSTYSPYSNICPISGRSGLTVYRSDSDTSDAAEFPVTWETEAGTVYGGTLDVVSGKLTVDRGYNKLSDLTGWGPNSNLTNGIMRAVIPNVVKPGSNEVTTAIMDCRKAVAYGPLQPTWTTSFAISYEGRLVVPMNRQITVAEFLSEYGNHEVCYPIVTPIEFQLTTQEITTLLGVNNIWADSGNILELEYVADTKLYIGESQSGTLGPGRQTISNTDLQPVSEKTLEDVGEAYKAETVGEKTHEESDDERGE